MRILSSFREYGLIWGALRSVNLWHEVDEADLQETMVEIRRAYEVPTRHYHTIGHVGECLGELEDCSGWTVETALALLFHDAVMEFGRSDNEERSAAFARRILDRLGAPVRAEQMIIDFILATKHAAAPESLGAKLVVDADLAILGQEAENFWQYEDEIRAEYAFVPEEIFRTKRAEILEGFLARPAIYSTQCFREKYEAQARKNLRRSIVELRGK